MIAKISRGFLWDFVRRVLSVTTAVCGIRGDPIPFQQFCKRNHAVNGTYEIRAFLRLDFYDVSTLIDEKLHSQRLSCNSPHIIVNTGDSCSVHSQSDDHISSHVFTLGFVTDSPQGPNAPGSCTHVAAP